MNTVVIAMKFQLLLQRDLIKSASRVRHQWTTRRAANTEQTWGRFLCTFTHELSALRNLPQTQNVSVRRNIHDCVDQSLLRLGAKRVSGFPDVISGAGHNSSTYICFLSSHFIHFLGNTFHPTAYSFWSNAPKLQLGLIFSITEYLYQFCQ